MLRAARAGVGFSEAGVKACFRAMMRRHRPVLAAPPLDGALIGLLRQAAEQAFISLTREDVLATGWIPDQFAIDGMPLDERRALQQVLCSHFQCGPAANEMSRFMRENGRQEFKTRYVGGHYVVEDQRSGLFFDLEAWRGARCREALPIAMRFRLMETIGGGSGVVTSSSYETICKAIFRFSARRLQTSWVQAGLA